MGWLEFLYQHPERILREVLVVFLLSLFCYDYKKHKPFGMFYWLCVLATLFVTALALSFTVLFTIGVCSAWMNKTALLIPVLFGLILFSLFDVMVYFCIRRLIHMTRYYRKLKEEHL